MPIIKKSEWQQDKENIINKGYINVEQFVNAIIKNNNTRIEVSQIERLIGCTPSRADVTTEVLRKLEAALKDSGWSFKRVQGYDQRDHDGWDYITIT